MLPTVAGQIAGPAWFLQQVALRAAASFDRKLDFKTPASGDVSTSQPC